MVKEKKKTNLIVKGIGCLITVFTSLCTLCCGCHQCCSCLHVLAFSQTSGPIETKLDRNTAWVLLKTLFDFEIHSIWLL